MGTQAIDGMIMPVCIRKSYDVIVDDPFDAGASGAFRDFRNRGPVSHGMELVKTCRTDAHTFKRLRADQAADRMSLAFLGRCRHRR